MPRNLYGNSLPSVAESRDSDIFYDINTGKSYVFDNGQWNELPQTPGGGGCGDLPEPTITDAGKVLGVNDQGKYALVEGGGIPYGALINFEFPEDTNVEDITAYRTTGVGVFYVWDTGDDIVSLGFVDDKDYEKLATLFTSEGSPVENLAYTSLLVEGSMFQPSASSSGFYLKSALSIKVHVTTGNPHVLHDIVVLPYSSASNFGFFKGK